MYDIVILDSGLSVNSSEQISGLCIKVTDGNEITIDSENYADLNGHGTIIYNTIRKYAPESCVLMVKIFDDKHDIDEDNLLVVLNYIKDNIPCRIINLSCGLKICHKISIFKKLCADIVASGTIIVAAFDNDNNYSYPACFDEVIGVDNNDKINYIYDYEFVESSPINIRAKGRMQRVKIEGDKYAVVSGSSIACAYIASYISQLCKDTVLNHDSVLDSLKKNASYVYPALCYDRQCIEKDKFSYMKNVAVFPVNKEMHAFIRFKEMLSFQIQHFYDVRYSGRVGMKINKLCSDADAGVCIEDIAKAEFEDIDTIIIGHLDELNELCGYDIRERVLNAAKEKAINIYSFDALNEYRHLLENSGTEFFYPSVSKADVPQNTFGKLYVISKPVVGIFGTSSRQGKFSLQLTLKNIFEKNNYRIGTVGTEPHSLLFNMDSVYPMGYNSTVYINSWESITYLNNQIQKLCESDAELIIVSSQAGSVPQNYYNLMDYPVKQSIFLMGTHPDAIILCVNIYDEISYLKNTIQVLEGLSDAKVIALVMYPLSSPLDYNRMYRPRIPISIDEFYKAAQLLHSEFCLPVYLLGDSKHMLMLYDNIINFF